MFFFFHFRAANLKRVLSQIIVLSFIFMSVVPPSPVLAQSHPLALPAPQQMIQASSGYKPAVMRGLVIHPDNPLEFDFIIDKGEEQLAEESLATEVNRLVKYFLTALTIPEDEMWVNLSPYEDNRVIADRFGETEMGHDLLAQDYILKQLTASLMYPEEELGQRFWQRVHQRAQEKFGTTDIPMNTFNKVWIVPESATIYQKDHTAFVLQSRLKVMLEEDYRALQQSTQDPLVAKDKIVSGVSSQVIKEIIIPEIEKEINEGEHFAPLRQMYHSLVLAAWFKINLKESLLGQVYVDQNKTRGVDLADPQVNQVVYERYVEAFKKGVYNFIREDYDPVTEQVIPRRYFSGGGDMRAVQSVVRRGTIDANAEVDGAVMVRVQPLVDAAMQAQYVASTVKLYDVGESAKRADIDGIQQYASVDQSMLSDQAKKYEAVSEVFLDDYLWSQISREAIRHAELNGLGVAGQEAWFSQYFESWVHGNFPGPENAARRRAVLASFKGFVEDVKLYKWNINNAYAFDLGFMNVAREYLYRLKEFNRLASRSRTVIEQTLAFSRDEQVKALLEPLVDGKLPVFGDAVLESLIPALARAGNDPNAQVALGAGGLGFLDGETVAGILKYLKGNWGSTDGYAGLSALPLYEVFQRRTIAAQEVDWDNQRDIKPFMVPDERGQQRHMKYKVNFSGVIHDTPRMMHKRNDLQKKLRLSADEVNRYWDRLIEMGVIDEVSKRGKINDNVIDVLRARHQDFDGREQEIYNLLTSLRADAHPEGQEYEVEVYLVDNEGTPQFTMRAPKFDIFHHLYPGGNQQWIQYAFYGKAYVQLLRELGVAPDVLMLNEGQTVFVAIEMMNDINRARLMGARSMFEDVKIVYKTHTPNPAALPIYEGVDELRGMLGWDMVPSDLLTHMYGRDHFYAPKALADLADLIIAVSDENAHVARRIIVPGFDVEGVQNGSLPQDWYPDELAEVVSDKGYQGVSGQEIYDIRRKAKLALNDNLRELLADVMGSEGVPQFDDLANRPLVGLLRRMVRYKGQGMMVPLIEWIVGDSDTQYFDFEDKLLGYGQGANLLIGGEAQDEYGEEWVARFRRMQHGAFTREDLAEMDHLTISQVNEVWDTLKRDGMIQERFGAAIPAGNWKDLENDDAQIEVNGEQVRVADRFRGYNKFLFRMFVRMENLKGKVIYIEKTGKNVMKAATTAVDLWLSMPDPTQEASGTSHQRVGLAGGLNVGVVGAGFTPQIEHGVNGWLINAFPEVSLEELIDMFNIGVKSEFRQKVVRNMHEYWKRARPQLRDYIQDAMRIYRAHANADIEAQANHQWVEMLKSAFDQAHETVTIEHNNIRNKMAFDAALDGSGAEGIRRRKSLGEGILKATGPVINLLVQARLEGADAKETAAHIQDLGGYLTHADDTLALPERLQQFQDPLAEARLRILTAVLDNNMDVDTIRDLLIEELAVDVTYRVSRAQQDAAILVVDDDVRDEPEPVGDPRSAEKYHSIAGEVGLIESTFDPVTNRTTHLSYGVKGVIPYFRIMVEGDQVDDDTLAIIAVYERGGYMSDASTRMTKFARLDGREITIISRYDAGSNLTTHSYSGITTGPRRDRVPGFDLAEPEPGFFALRTGEEIVALRVKGYFTDAAVLGEARQAELTAILNFSDTNPETGGLYSKLFFLPFRQKMQQLGGGTPLSVGQLLEGYRSPIERIASVGKRFILSGEHHAVTTLLREYGIDPENDDEVQFIRQALEDDRAQQIQDRIGPALDALVARMNAAQVGPGNVVDLLRQYLASELGTGLQTEVRTILLYGHEVRNDRFTGVDPAYADDVNLVIAELAAMADAAVMVAPTVSHGTEQKYGGIDLNTQLLDLQIKRDGAGIPLPLNQQPTQNMYIEGFVPVIINIVPVNNLPLLLGLDRGDVIPDNKYTVFETLEPVTEPERII